MGLCTSCKSSVIVIKQLEHIGRRALFSYRAQYDVIEFLKYSTEERSEAKLSSFGQFANEIAQYRAL